MDKNRIVLCTHDPEWSNRFADESMLLRQLLGNSIAQIHHVGSTAIPIIKAKPIVDLLVESDVFPPTEQVLNSLDKLEYSNRGEAGVIGRRWFIKGNPRQFNLHWCPQNGVVAQSQLAFRDRLNQNKDLARQYEMIKMAASPEQDIDSNQYAQAKSDFIAHVLTL